MIKKLLIANRGEIAIRIGHAAAELGMRSVAVYPRDDEQSLHVRRADEACLLEGRGAGAYLDLEQVIRVAKQAGCDAVHPGYGFLSENARFARRCGEEGLVFVGPRPEVLELFGDKTRARACARDNGVPLLEGTEGPTGREEVKAFLESLGPGAGVVIKAVAGGGGRGMRIVHSVDEVDAAYERCRSEAAAAFGNGDLYAERLMARARHVEIQLLGDGAALTHLHDRDCTVQRQGQKLIEIAPAPGLSPGIRARLIEAALRLGRAARLDNLATVEFLIDLDRRDEPASVAFLEVNPRIQVEHTVTEEVTGVDLVKAQLRIAGGSSLSQLGLTDGVPFPRGHAVQLRVNLETLDESGRARPSGGCLTVFEIPSGPGVRVDTHGYAGYSANPGYDSLLAKLVCRSVDEEWTNAIDKSARVLRQFRVAGAKTNIQMLAALLAREELATGSMDTRFIERNARELGSAAAGAAPAAPAEVDAGAGGAVAITAPNGTEPLISPMTATVVAFEVAPGDVVARGQTVLVVEAMKMEHLVVAERAGRVNSFAVALQQTVGEGQAVAFIEPLEAQDAVGIEADSVDLDAMRPDLLEVMERHAITLDERRPDAVERRRKTGQRTARENIADLCDPGSFAEYGGLVVAAQRRTRPLQELIETTQADGMVTGIGSINGDRFDARRARAAVLAYDYTVFAGTQSYMNHRKSDRLLELAHTQRLPVVFFAEGGGGRPGVSDHLTAAGLSTMTFVRMAQLNGLVPLVGIVSGRCFAGNAAILGSCDVVIATRNSNIGLGGPAMIEGGGLGVYRPEQIGPVEVQSPNGVIDVLVDDEAQAVRVAKQYLSYFQGTTEQWTAGDQRGLRHLIPENRLRSYDVRSVMEALFDVDSVLELRREFGVGILTALARIEGRPVGVIANNPRHLGGAIDADASDKASRFMQLCDGFGLPIVSLCDTPGFMVGPEAERTAQVRHACRMFVTAASISVPIFTVVLRKGYGLGAMAMGGGALHRSAFALAWPTGEFGGMGLEGAVRLGHRRELEAIEDPGKRRARFDELLAMSYEKGKAISTASFYEIDEVIDPADTRWWLLRGLEAVPTEVAGSRRRTMIDTW